MNDFIYFVNTVIYLSMCYHYQLHRTWNQCNFMEKSKSMKTENLSLILLEMSLCMACFVVWLELWQLNCGTNCVCGITGYMGVTQKECCC